MQSPALLELPADIQDLIDQAARRAGVPLRSPLLPDIRPQAVDGLGASNVILFSMKRAARG